MHKQIGGEYIPMKTKIVKVALIVFVGLGLASGAYSYYMRQQAESCLSVIKSLRLGSECLSESREKLARFKKFETQGVTNINGKNYQTWVYRFENRPSTFWGIFRPARFETGMTFDSAALVAVGAGMAQRDSLMVGTQETIFGLLGNKALDDNGRGMIIGLYDPPSRMNVILDSRASEKNRELAFSYKFHCFTSILGCRDGREILPQITNR